jgi:hypothetical protein
VERHPAEQHPVEEGRFGSTRRNWLLSTAAMAYLANRLSAQEPAAPEKAPAEAKPAGTAEMTREAERAVRRGEEWLLKTMTNQGGCGVDIGQQPDIGCTSMVGLAFLAQGNTAVEGQRSREIRRIANYLLQRVESMPQDDITSEMGTQLQNKIGRHAHSFFASLFLSELLGEGSDPEPIRVALKKVVAAIVGSQTADGNWGNQSWAPMLGTVMGWVALRAASNAGMTVGNSPETTAKYLVQQMSTTLAHESGSWMHTLYKNATGIRVLFALGKDEEPIAKKAFSDVVAFITRDNTAFSQAGGEEYLAFHLITETMLQKGGEDWLKWYPKVRDRILAVQNNDGSWTGHHCITSRTFCTAAAILVLTSPNRYLPISQA